MNTSGLTPANLIEGEDEEETVLLREMLAEARGFIQSFHWCPEIFEEYLGFGIGGLLAVFLFRFASAVHGTDEYLWVVVGDLPSAYLVTDAALSPRSAAEVYCHSMQDWVSAVLSIEPLDDVFPVQVDATEEMAEKLDSRLRYLRERIMPLIPS